jgi:hypothetical protein
MSNKRRAEREAAITSARQACTEARAVACHVYEAAVDAAYREHTLNKQTLAGPVLQDALNAARDTYKTIEDTTEQACNEAEAAAEKTYAARLLAEEPHG